MLLRLLSGVKASLLARYAKPEALFKPSRCGRAGAVWRLEWLLWGMSISAGTAPFEPVAARPRFALPLITLPALIPVVNVPLSLLSGSCRRCCALRRGSKRVHAACMELGHQFHHVPGICACPNVSADVHQCRSRWWISQAKSLACRVVDKKPYGWEAVSCAKPAQGMVWPTWDVWPASLICLGLCSCSPLDARTSVSS